MEHEAQGAARYLVVGLGNPGRAYAHTRHNIGAECVSQLAERLGIALSRRTHRARWGAGCVPATASGGAGNPDGLRVTLARPRLFMNASGRCVPELARARRVDLPRLLIVVDHMDLPLGRIRARPQGGSGGHNGMRSVMQHLGSNAFPRLHIGIGRPPGRQDPADFVLRRFTRQEQQTIVEGLKTRVGEAIVYWMRYGMEATMNEYNRKP